MSESGRMPVTARDRRLVEWVARASPGDRIPEPWRWARSPMESVILTLVGLRVITYPSPDTGSTVIVQEAAAAARAWLADRGSDGGSATSPG